MTPPFVITIKVNYEDCDLDPDEIVEELTANIQRSIGEGLLADGAGRLIVYRHDVTVDTPEPEDDCCDACDAGRPNEALHS